MGKFSGTAAAGHIATPASVTGSAGLDATVANDVAPTNREHDNEPTFRHVNEGSVLEAAKAYADLGLQPVQLHHVRVDGSCSCGNPECAPGRKKEGSIGKHPVALGWCETPTTRPWREDDSIGLAMGPQPGGFTLLALDVDGELGRASLARLEAMHSRLPRTLASRTGRVDGGNQYVFCLAPGQDVAKIRNQAGKLGARIKGEKTGLDVRTQGGQIVVAPSVHRSGRKYQWIDTNLPAELPDWLYRLLIGQTQPGTPDTVADGVENYGHSALEKACKVLRATKDGERNDTLNRKAFTLYQIALGPNGLSPDMVTARLTEAARKAGLTDSEIAATLRSARTAAEAKPRDLREEYGHDLLRGSHVELANAVHARFAADRPFIHTAGAFYTYDDDCGLWTAVDAAPIHEAIHAYDGKMCWELGRKLSLRAPDIEGTTKVLRSLAAERRTPQEVQDEIYFFDAPRPGIAMANGFLTVDGLEGHSPDHRARHGVAYDYKPDGSHELIDTLLADLFADVPEGERQARVAAIQEFAGACLFGIAPRYQKCLLLLGEGGNGKSQVLEILMALLPKATLAAVPPHLWGQRFQLAKLDGALLNVCNELPEREILASDTFKGVVTGDPVTFERKNQDPYTGRVRAGHAFSANQLMPVRDTSGGFFDRWLIVRLTRNMRESSERVLDVGKQIRELEAEGVIAWAAEGTRRLIRQRHYTIPACHAEQIEVWRGLCDSVFAFIRDETEPNEMGTRSSITYQAYVRYCQTNGHQRVSMKEFKRRLERQRIHQVPRADANYYPFGLKSPGFGGK